MITRARLVDQLTALPVKLEAMEEELQEASRRLDEARNALAERRVALLLEPETINGRNEQLREAQLFDLTRGEREDVTLAEARLARVRLQLNRLQHEFTAARSCARLIGGTDPDA